MHNMKKLTGTYICKMQLIKYFSLYSSKCHHKLNLVSFRKFKYTLPKLFPAQNFLRLQASYFGSQLKKGTSLFPAQFTQNLSEIIINEQTQKIEQKYELFAVNSIGKYSPRSLISSLCVCLLRSATLYTARKGSYLKRYTF